MIGRWRRTRANPAGATSRGVTPRKLEDDLVEVVGSLVIEVALHQRRMRIAMRLGIFGVLLIAAAFAGAVYLAVDTRTAVSRSPCANLRAPGCFRKLVDNASPRTLANLRARLRLEQRRTTARERRRLNRRHDSGPVTRPHVTSSTSRPSPGASTPTSPPTRRPARRHRTTTTSPSSPSPSQPTATTPAGTTSAPPQPRPLVDLPAPTVTTPAGTVTAPNVCARPAGGVGC
jgi:hypothetical protein